MKKLLGILVLGFLLSGCAPTTYNEVLNSGYTYTAYVESKQLIGMNKGGWGGSPNSQAEATRIAMSYCRSAYSDCVLTYEGSTYVYKEETKKIVKKEPKKKKSGPDDNEVVAASMGSGFFVTRAGHLVTNYHVIEGCDAVKTNISGKEIRTDIVAVDKTNDLAIIKAEMNPSKVFPVSNKDVSLMQDVIVAGFPLGKKVSSGIKIHKGNVTALAGFGDNYSNFQTDATINQGNSGGPIMNQKGNIVGVAVQLIAAEHAQNVFFGVKSSTLKTFANANNIKFLSPNIRELSNEDLGKLITEATVFLDCWMTVAKIKRIIAQEENRKAFYSEHR